LRYLIFFCLAVFVAVGLRAQAGVNPFELHDAAPVDTLGSVTATGGSGSVEKADKLIFIHLFLLVFLASLWVLFRGLLRQCIAGVVNDSVLTQLYRRRSEGQVAALWLAYLYFLLIAGMYLFLLARQAGLAAGWGSLAGWLFASLLTAAVLGLKLVVLHLLGRIYGLRKPVSRYTFLLMVFAIVTGLFLFPLNLLVSYAPPGWTTPLLLGGLTLLALVYFLHLLRGTFIARPYLSGRPLHFLLYLCLIEVAPILLVYRYLSSTT
jgi:hypothetical protein